MRIPPKINGGPERRAPRRLASWFLASVSVLPWTAGAQQASDSPFAFSGFGTVGLVRQIGADGLGFGRNTTQVGAGSRLSAQPDSRLGGQVNWNGGARWDGAVQGVLLPNPHGAPAQEILQQAYLGYRALPDTRVRLGRISPDVFLYSDSRNVGYALPFARPPVDFYGFAPLASVDGVDLDQRWNVGDSTWRARATAGWFRTSVVSASSATRVELRGRQALSASLSHERDGLLLKLSYLRGHVDAQTGDAVADLRQALDGLRTLPLPGIGQRIDALGRNFGFSGDASYLGLAAQYERGPWTLVAEGSRMMVPDSPLSARRGYASLGWRNGSVNYFGFASRVKPDQARTVTPDLAGPLAPVIGPNAAKQAQTLAGIATSVSNSLRYDQSTVGAGIRWDFAPNAALTFQVDRFDIRQDGGAAWRGYQGQAVKGTLVTLLVDFVWGQ